jgi:hypothetical protein
MGDFNLPNLLKSETHPINSFDSAFQDLLQDLPLYNNVSNNTRYRGTDVPSILDLILTSEEHVVENLSYDAPLGLSDHLILTFKYVCEAQRSSDAYKMIRMVDITTLSEALQNVTDWDDEGHDVNQHWSGMTTILRAEIESHSYLVPKKPKHGFHLQIRSRTKKWIRMRNASWENHRRQPTSETWEIFRLLRNKVNNLIKTDKQQYQAHLLRKMEQNPKLLYRIVNNNAKVKPGVSPLQTTDKITSTAVEAAEELVKFYSTIFCPREHVDAANDQRTSASDTLSDMTIDADTVLKILLELDVRKSPGADGITPLILKRCAHSLYIPLTKLFNHSLHCSQVPADWKRGTITPIYKGGARSLASNYRPVTLLSTTSKVLERVVTRRIIEHLEEHSLLSIAQHGFRKNYSCVTNLLLTLDDWTQAVDRGYPIHACYLDISKAFDRVNHCILLRKLKEHGIDGKLLAWLEDYLTDRTVQVRVDGALSKPVPVTSGVPQGSVLAPILFIIYANDIPSLIRCKITLFADDIKLWTHIRTVEDCKLLQKDLDALHEWSLANKLPFNTSKCKMLNVGKPFAYAYELGQQQLAWTNEEKDLGVWITNTLKTSLQCNSVYKKTSHVLALLKRIFGRFTKETLPIIINTYIRPCMEYAVQTWSPWLQKDVELLQRIYHRATKCVTGLQHKPYAERITYLNLFDFHYRRIRGDLILTYHILNTPNHPLQTLFKPGRYCVTRKHQFALAIPVSHVNCRRYFFAVRVTFLWNSLPESVVSCANIYLFKTSLDDYMRTKTTAELQF